MDGMIIIDNLVLFNGSNQLLIRNLNIVFFNSFSPDRTLRRKASSSMVIRIGRPPITAFQSFPFLKLEDLT